MDMGSAEIVYNPENVTFNLIITSSKAEIFPLSEGEESQYVFSMHRKISSTFREKSSLCTH